MHAFSYCGYADSNIVTVLMTTITNSSAVKEPTMNTISSITPLSDEDNNTQSACRHPHRSIKTWLQFSSAVHR